MDQRRAALVLFERRDHILTADGNPEEVHLQRDQLRVKFVISVSKGVLPPIGSNSKA